MAAAERESGAWLACGAGSAGSLATGNEDDMPNFTNTEIPEDALRVAHGGCHGAYLDSQGHVWLWGENKHGQCSGAASKEGTGWQPVPTRLHNDLLKQPVCQVACGWAHSLFLLQGGTIMACGDNTWGQCGSPKLSDSHGLEEVTLAAGGITSVAVSAGFRHSAAVMADGSVFLWGDDARGQCSGSPASKPARRPGQRGLARPPPALPSHTWQPPFPEQAAVAAALGWRHTLILLACGDVVSFGDNSAGQCGRLPLCKWCAPGSVQGGVGMGPVAGIAAGWNHAVALCKIPGEAGQVWTWGRGDMGQLGRPLPSGCKGDAVPHPVQLAVDSAGGGDAAALKFIATGSNHCLCATSSGQCWSWGWGEHGNLGQGTTADEATPVRILGQAQGIAGLAAAGAASFAKVHGALETAQHAAESVATGPSTVSGEQPAPEPGACSAEQHDEHS